MSFQLSDFGYIRHFIFDIDGVLTNGTLVIHPDGTLMRTMNIKDGYALQLAVKKGYSVSIISGAKGDSLEKRFLGLGIHDIYLGIDEKLQTFLELVKNNTIDKSKTLYMGDDMPDIAAMLHVSLPCCPADACIEVKNISKYISHLKGGEGCVRDVIEKVLKLNNDWE